MRNRPIVDICAYVTSRSFGTHYTLRSDTTIENAAHWRPGRFRVRSSRGGRPYLPIAGDRGFESFSLHRRVRCEPDFRLPFVTGTDPLLPTEVFAPISSEFNKAPIESWRQYAPLFREYSTVSILPELLAALAQVESAGNPVATTYWRWRLTPDPFAVYQPASSAVGMYQMTDAAFAEAQGYCILHHTVVESRCDAVAVGRTYL
jgi:Transglycosylase SLT domain